MRAQFEVGGGGSGLSVMAGNGGIEGAGAIRGTGDPMLLYPARPRRNPAAGGPNRSVIIRESRD